jgi:hypothetical protein
MFAEEKREKETEVCVSPGGLTQAENKLRYPPKKNSSMEIVSREATACLSK